MKALVTGGAGFIGSHLVDRLVEEGHQVLVADDLSTGLRENLHFKTAFCRCNIEMGNDLMYQLERRAFRPDIIFHLAGQSSLQRSLQNPGLDLRINTTGTLKVIEVARHFDVGIVFSSTSAVYAPQPRRLDEAFLPYTEQSPLGPTSPYGVSKLAAEFYLQQSGVPYVILRYGNVYGPRQIAVGENQLIPHCLAHLYREEPFKIYGGTSQRDYIYVDDVVDANCSAAVALQAGIHNIYNIGKGWATTTDDICSMLAVVRGYKADYTFDRSNEGRLGELPYVALLATAARADLLWTAKTTLQDGIDATVARWPKGL